MNDVATQGFNWVNMLNDIITVEHEVSGSPSVSGAGMLVVPLRNGEFKQPLTMVRSVTFVPGKDDTEKPSMFAFMEQETADPAIHVEYVGTFTDTNDFEGVKELLNGVKIGYHITHKPR